MDELKPCPFCGGEVRVVYNSMGKMFRFYHKDKMDAIHCPVLEPIQMCGIDVMSLEGAAEAWNRRDD